MSDNTAEEEFWSGPAGEKWIAHEAEQDHFLSKVAQAILDAADLQPGERALDLGCGAGAVTLMAAEAVGSGGQVLASDIAPPFIDHVDRRAALLPQVATHLGDAQTTNWPVTDFDAALSRFGVMFFADPAAAFANIRAALRPGGRIAFAAWAGIEENPYWRVPRDLFAERFGPRPRPEPNAPGPMGLADADRAMAQMRAGGLSDVHAETREIPLLHEDGAAGVASLALRIGPSARALAEADATEDQNAEFETAAAQAFRLYEFDGKARVPALIHLFSARNG